MVLERKVPTQTHTVVIHSLRTGESVEEGFPRFYDRTEVLEPVLRNSKVSI